jgi:hypothetical protein
MKIQTDGFKFTSLFHRLENTLSNDRVMYNTIRSIVRGGHAVVTLFMEQNGFEWADCGTVFVKATVETLAIAEDTPAPAPVSFKPLIKDRPVIVTSYLLGTKVDSVIWESLLVHINRTEANLVIIPHRYRNPTTLVESLRQTEAEADVYIDPRVVPFLSWERFSVYGHTVFSDVRLPLNSIHCLGQAKTFVTQDSIFGHPIQAMSTVPKLQATGLPPTAWTTGTISQIDPADNITAKRAEFHYKYGWIVVEPAGSSRNIHICKDGSFTDLGQTIVNRKLGELRQPIAVFGDLHFGQHSSIATDWAWGLANDCGVSDVVLHDFFDAATVNPHASRYERSKIFGGELLYEVTEAQRYLEEQADRFAVDIHLVPSNHNDMLSRYFLTSRVSDLTEGDAEVLAIWLQAGRDVEKMLWPRTDFKQMSTGITLDQHGHKGINGSKGGLVGFFNTGARLVFGHTHTPGMVGAVSNVGTLSKKNLGYNAGGCSSWKPSITLIDCFDKRQELVFFANGWG